LCFDELVELLPVAINFMMDTRDQLMGDHREWSSEAISPGHCISHGPAEVPGLTLPACSSVSI